MFKTLIEIRDGRGEMSEHRSFKFNERVRSVGEMVENQTIKGGLVRVERAAKSV